MWPSWHKHQRYRTSNLPVVQGKRACVAERVVRKSHYHVFLGVLDPGQAPPNPWSVVETNTRKMSLINALDILIKSCRF